MPPPATPHLRETALKGGGKPGLIPVKKTIIHRGKPIEVTYWVKDPNAKKKPEGGGGGEGTGEGGGGGGGAGGGGGDLGAGAGAGPKPPPGKEGKIAIKKKIVVKGKEMEVTYWVKDPNVPKKPRKKKEPKEGGEAKPEEGTAPPPADKPLKDLKYHERIDVDFPNKPDPTLPTVRSVELAGWDPTLTDAAANAGGIGREATGEEVRQLQDFFDEHQGNFRALSNVATHMTGMGTGTEKFTIVPDARMGDAAATHNQATKEMRIGARYARHLVQVIKNGEVSDGVDEFAVSLLLHESFHGASNKRYQYDGSPRGSSPVPGTIMEEATTELLAVHFRREFAEKALGVQWTAVSERSEWSVELSGGDRSGKHLFSGGHERDDKTGNTRPEVVISTGNVAYREYVQGFGRMVAVVDNLDRNMPAEKLSAHIAGRALQAKQMSNAPTRGWMSITTDMGELGDPRPREVRNNELMERREAAKYQPLNNRYNIFVRKVMDRYKVPSPKDETDLEGQNQHMKIAQELRWAIGDFIQGRANFTTQDSDKLARTLKNIAKGKEYRGMRKEGEGHS